MEHQLLHFLSTKENFQLRNQLDTELTRILYAFQSEIGKMMNSNNQKLRLLRSKLPGRVSKGNNHHGYPYQVLDYPAFISKEASFSFRTSIWYGNFFSFALILSGHFLKDTPISFQRLQGKNYLFTTDPNIWETDDSLYTIKDIDSTPPEELQGLIEKADHCKIYIKHSLNQIESLIRLGKESLETLLFL